MESEGYSHLIPKAQAGDQVAMGRLLALVRPHLEMIAKRYADPDDAARSASDLVQESWVRAWKSLGQFKGGHEERETAAMFRSWTAEILRNIGRQARRERATLKRGAGRRVVRLGPEESGPGGIDAAASGSTPSAGLHREEEARRIQEALARIPDGTEREVVRLRFFEKLNMREIAARLTLTYEQVRERYHRGIRRVGRELKRFSGNQDDHESGTARR